MPRFPLLSPHLLRTTGLTRLVPFLAAALSCAALAAGESRVSGVAVLEEDGTPAANAEVLLLETGDVTHTDDEGRFALDVTGLSSASLHLDFGHLTGFAAATLDPDSDAELMLDEPVPLDEHQRAHEQVTVTASAFHAAPLESFGQVQSMEGLDLANESARTVAELLEGTPGIAIRSFGPGSARPIVRGFDGDRVLVMEDGVRTGDLASQSADHGVPVDPLQAERVEVVRGPATLLFGANAIGGAVNVISMASHLAHAPPPGFRGHANLDWSSADAGRRGGARVQAAGSHWFAWGGGNSNRTDEYDSPAGVVERSQTEMTQGEVGLGLFNERVFFSVSGRMDDARYGVPFAGEFHGAHGDGDDGHDHAPLEEGEELAVDLEMQRRQVRADLGFHDLGFFDEAEFTLRASDYDHDEVETILGTGEEFVATHFDNRAVVLRGELKRSRGRVESRIGAWGNFREYMAAGEEALAPATVQNAYAAFAYNEITASDRLSWLLGARMERNIYDTENRAMEEEHMDEEEDAHGHDHGHDRGDEEEEEEHVAPPVRDRSFLGVSGSTGLRLRLSDAGALVATASYSTRAPALEELYNFGPHIGNLAFEIGNAELDPEQSLGFDLSLRRSGETEGSISVFRYDISNFIFGAATGEMEGALQVLVWGQEDATYSGFEIEGHRELGRLGLTGSVSYVQAELASGEPLPRIPPLQGEVRLEVPFGRLRIEPRLRFAGRADRVYQGETPTDGYSVFDLTAAYVLVRNQMTHNFSVRGYNLFDTEYRYHTSLIKDLVPQMGRGIRVSYSLRFF